MQNVFIQQILIITVIIFCVQIFWRSKYVWEATLLSNAYKNISNSTHKSCQSSKNYITLLTRGLVKWVTIVQIFLTSLKCTTQNPCLIESMPWMIVTDEAQYNISASKFSKILLFQINSIGKQIELEEKIAEVNVTLVSKGQGFDCYSRDALNQ